MLRTWLGPLRRQGPRPDPRVTEVADLVLISHLHLDHLDLRALRTVPADTPVVVSRGAAKWAAKGGAENIHELSVGETISIDGVELTGVRAVHDGYRNIHRGEEVDALGYLIKRDGRQVYFAGDTDLFDEMAELPAVDLALLPVWGWGLSLGEGHLDPERAARAIEMIRPRVVVPIHWGTFFPVGLRLLRPEPLREPPRELARLAAEVAPEVEVRVLPPGSETSLD